MDAILLVGGQGTRLAPVVSDVPKPLAPVRGVPFLDFLLQQLQMVATRVILAVGYKGEQVIERYKKMPHILFSKEKTPLGTGGALRKALELVSSEYVWILNGDSFFAISFSAMLESRVEVGADITIACRYVDDVSRYGSIEMEGRRIIAFREKRESGGPGWINGGIYLMRRELLLDWPLDTPFSLEKEAFSLLVQKRCFAYPSDGKFIDIGTPESYRQAEEIVKL
ncbi:MAG: nucleotidyltransferase family protein [Chlamydiales bacterium]